MNDNLNNVTILPPFKRFCMTIGELPTSYIDSMTYYESLVWLCNYLQKTVIPTINANGEAVIELQEKYIELKEYVDNYFENLDVQEEINNKLDDMAEQGQLTEIITAYLQMFSVLGYDTKDDLKDAENIVSGSIARTLGDTSYTNGDGHYYKIRDLEEGDVIDDDNLVELTNFPSLVAEKIPDFLSSQLEIKFNVVDDMMNATNLQDGFYCKTLGFYSINDGGSSLYSIRNKTGADNPDYSTLFPIGDDLVAELITNDEMNIKQFGSVGNDDTMDTLAMTNAIANCKVININSDLLLNYIAINKSIILKGNGTITANATQLFGITHDEVIIDDLNIDGNGKTYTIIFNGSKNSKVVNCKFTGTIGHYILVSNASDYATIENNTFSSNASSTTPVVITGSSNVNINENYFINNGGFNIQTRINARKVNITNNHFKNPISIFNHNVSQAENSITFITPKKYARKGVKVNGTFAPSYSLAENDNGYVVSFSNNLSPGDVVTLYGCDSLELININSNSYEINVDNNMMEGTGDSGIVLGADYHNGVLDPSHVTADDYPSNITITNNIIGGCFYAGIAETHKCNNVIIAHNQIKNTALGITESANVYDACIYANGENVVIDSNMFIKQNTDVQNFAIVFRPGANNADRYMNISNNTYVGNFLSRKTAFAANTTNVYKGVNDYEDSYIDLPVLDLSGSWSTKPSDTSYVTYAAFNTGVSRDTANGLISTANAIATIGGSYIDCNLPTNYLKNKIITIEYDVNSADDHSYVRLFVKPGSGSYVDVTDSATTSGWEHHKLQVITGTNLTSALIRVGANSGLATQGYYQNFKCTIQNYM